MLVFDKIIKIFIKLVFQIVIVIIFIIPAKIDLITQNSEGKYFILDYKTSKKSEKKIAFYQNQLNEYKKIIKEVFNIENLEELKTDIIFLG